MAISSVVRVAKIIAWKLCQRFELKCVKNYRPHQVEKVLEKVG